MTRRPSWYWYALLIALGVCALGAGVGKMMGE
jgi:hypothetical protein